MTVSQEKISLIILYSFVLGAFLGILYDVFRIIRIARRTDRSNKKAVKLLEGCIVFFEDILFSLICSVTVCIFVFYINSGRVRGISIFVMALGFILYHNTVGRLIIALSGYIINFVKYIVRKIYSIFLRPLLIILCLLCKITLYRAVKEFFTLEKKAFDLKKAENGFDILKLRKQGKIKNEKTVKHICQGGSIRVYNILHGHDSEDAV